MYGVTDTFLSAVRRAHTAYMRVDAYQGGVILDESDGLPADYVEDGLPIQDGSVTVNAGTGVRRTLDLTLTDRNLWSVLEPVGIELVASRGIRYPNGVVESVPLGVFGVDAESVQLAPGGGLSLGSCPDRWARVQRARFEVPEPSEKGDTIVSEIARLMTDAVPGVTVETTGVTSTAAVGALVWERDRDAAINDMLQAIGAEAFFDWTGQIVIRDAPLLSAAPSWVVDASATGVLLNGDRSRDRSRTYNVVVVSSSNIDGATPFAPQIVEDDDPTSATYVGGPMGRVPYFFASPLITTTGQATAAGQTILNRVKSLQAQLNVESVVNPALDRGDVIEVIAPGGVVERHLIESVTVPLTVDGSQAITTRSSRPEGDVPSEE